MCSFVDIFYLLFLSMCSLLQFAWFCSSPKGSSLGHMLGHFLSLLFPRTYGEEGLTEIGCFFSPFFPLDDFIQFFAFSVSHQTIRSSKEKCQAHL